MGRRGFAVGRVHGVEVRADWAWLPVATLLTATLATVVAPALDTDWGSSVSWAVSAGCALGYFLSVLARELARAWLARTQGHPVRRVTLHLFGGVPSTDRSPASPGVEIVTSLAGPILSLALGAVCLLAGSVWAGRGADALGDPVATLRGLNPQGALLLWLGPLNVALGLFHLLPAYPLDGGRILRALLWGATDDLRQATRIATYFGQVLGAALALAGGFGIFGAPLPLLPDGVLGGAPLLILGWSLSAAAVDGREQPDVYDLLEGVAVSGLMRPRPPAAQAESSVRNLVYERMMDTDNTAFPVLEAGELVGLVSLHDVRKVPRELWETTDVRAIMTPRDRLAFIEPSTDAAAALRVMAARDVGQLPVVSNGRLLGMLRRCDLYHRLEGRDAGADR